MCKKISHILTFGIFLGGLLNYCFSYDAWDPSKTYKTEDGIDTVSYNSYNGHTLLWFNKWWIDAADLDTPGCLLDSGGTSGWQVINSISASEGGTFTWEGCDDDPGSEATVCIPTWMDGAKGAYMSNHDDFGSCPDEYLKNSWIIAKEINDANRDYFGGYNPVRHTYGIQTNEVDEEEWAKMRELIKEGHEAGCHSHNHSSAAHQWQWYWQADATGDVLQELKDYMGTSGDTIPLSELQFDGQGDDDWVPSYASQIDTGDLSTPTWCGGAICLSPTGYSNAPGDPVPYAPSPYKVKQTSDARYIECPTQKWVYKKQAYAAVIDCEKRSPCNSALAEDYNGWNSSEFKMNVDDATKLINDNTYNVLKNNGTLEDQYNPPDKQCEFYIYPYDAYSIATHEYLDQHGYVSARGGGKCSLVTPADFIHPYLIYFDAYYSDDMGEYPDNPHQWMTLERMVNTIVRDNACNIRELHAVSDPADYWGACDPDHYKDHLNKVVEKMKNGDLTYLTASQCVKQVMVTSVTTASISGGTNNEWIISPKVGNLQNSDKYDNVLISYIVTLPSNTDDANWVGMASFYTSNDEPIRRQPRKLKRRGADSKHKWAVYANPFKGDVKIIGDMTANQYIFKNKMSNKNIKLASFVNGKIGLYMIKGNFEVTLYSPNGKAVRKLAGKSPGGYETVNMNVKNLSNGFYILNVKHDAGEIRHRVVLAQ